MNPKRAVTLIEILLCSLLLSTVIISLAVLFIRGLQLQQRSGNILQASQLSQQLLERIRQSTQPSSSTYLFDGGLPTPTQAGFPPPPYPVTQLDQNAYTFVIRSTPHPDGLRRVTVQVFFQNQQLTFETLMDS